ncbi:hypothetical protein EI94DRAFT_710236 [Lactarius quietus]|nr:hypothetical protein EI94DRAFT_710236 [Lactarius quietus]
MASCSCIPWMGINVNGSAASKCLTSRGGAPKRGLCTPGGYTGELDWRAREGSAMGWSTTNRATPSNGGLQQLRASTGAGAGANAFGGAKMRAEAHGLGRVAAFQLEGSFITFMTRDGAYICSCYLLSPLFLEILDLFFSSLPFLYMQRVIFSAARQVFIHWHTCLMLLDSEHAPSSSPTDSILLLNTFAFSVFRSRAYSMPALVSLVFPTSRI